MRGIDVHVHYPLARGVPRAPWVSDAAQHLGSDSTPESIDELAAYYERLDLTAVILNVDNRSNSGVDPLPNDAIADAVRRYPKRFIGLGSVDPWAGAAAVREVDRIMGDLGLAGLKFQPITQAFFPDDERFTPIWERCQALGAVVLVHMGTTAAGAGTPGGRGLRLKYGRPIPHLDDVAARFPDLTIIAAHPAWPWHEELLAVALHKSNVYFDLSGWAPKYFPESVVRHANSRLQDKALFGSDYPLFPLERWLKEFDELPLKPEVRQKILVENARRVFKLEV